MQLRSDSMRRPQFCSFIGIFVACIFCSGNVGGVGQSNIRGKLPDGSLIRHGSRSNGSPSICFVNLFSAQKYSAAEKKKSLLSSLFGRPQRALTLRQRRPEGCRMVFLPPEWEEAPSRRGDNDLDIDPFEVCSCDSLTHVGCCVLLLAHGGALPPYLHATLKIPITLNARAGTCVHLTNEARFTDVILFSLLHLKHHTNNRSPPRQLRSGHRKKISGRTTKTGTKTEQA